MPTVSSLLSLDSIAIDARLKDSFCLAVSAVQHGAAVSLTSIGRELSNFTGTSEKHAIKRVNHLVGHHAFSGNRKHFYHQFCDYFASQQHPLVLVDWAYVDTNSWALLRASIAFDGRAFTLYEEIFAHRTMNSHQCHQQFLSNLKSIMPQQCTPIICTDAGFKVPWFREVEKLNWYWIGRIRGTVSCSLDDGTTWETPSSIYAQACGKPKALPDILISKSKQHPARAVLSGKSKASANRKKRTTKSKCTDYRRYVKSAQDPWLIASNLPSSFDVLYMVNCYRRRMTIEEAFRDSKNEYYGLGLRRSKSRSIERLQVLLLILLVAQWELYLIGRAAENKGLHMHYQANTIRHRRVLSYCYLARRIMSTHAFDFTQSDLNIALNQLLELTKNVKI